MQFTISVEPIDERRVVLVYSFANGEVRNFESEAPTTEVPLEALVEKYKPCVLWDYPDFQPEVVPAPEGTTPRNTQHDIGVTVL